MQRIWIAIASLTGFGAVAMAAFTAHGIQDPNAARIAASGVQMQAWHALALLGTALWTPQGGRPAHAAAAAFAIGTVLFSGALYTHALTGHSLGPIAPIGGTILMFGWLLLTASAWRAR